MIIDDVIPAYIVEKKGFKDLISTLEPKYTMVSRKCIQTTIIPKKAHQMYQEMKECLQDRVESCSVTLDIWSSRRMHGYFGMTCHFITDDWQLKQLLLCCKHMKGRHTGDNIYMEYEAIVEEFGLQDKISKVVTDNASNMLKAFNITIFDDSKSDESDSDHSDDSDADFCNDDIDEDNIVFEIPDIPHRISCFAHTLQLTVKDGLQSSKQIQSLLAKVGKIVNHVKKSTVATEKLEHINEKGMIAKNDTRWNSQLKMIRRIMELDLTGVVEKKELHLSSHEKTVLRSFVCIFEPFETATDLLQGEKYSSIGMVIPAYLGLLKNLESLQVGTT